jgi:selenocysteine lyase/cysteine desulfurase
MPTKSFEYLEYNCYLDSACQSLRPKSVIEAELDYYTNSNACAGRANYPWAIQTETKISQVRRQILNFFGKDESQYAVVFGQNTTMFINLILQSIRAKNWQKIITTDKEHNSVLLPAMSFAKNNQKPLVIIPRNAEGTPNLSILTLHKPSIFILQTTSNLDGTCINNLAETVNFAKKYGHLVLLDATQSLAHHRLNFYESDFDCLFASGHKLYAPSLGFMVIKKDLIMNLDQVWVGGGAIQNINSTDWEFIEDQSQLHSRLELGLQDYAGIFGLGEALKWLTNYRVKQEYDKINYQTPIINSLSQKLFSLGASGEAIDYIESLSDLLFYNLSKIQNTGTIKILNQTASPIVSFVAKNISSYELTQKLGLNKIMCRSGYMCCHNYIRENLKSGPLVRISLGLNNTPKDIAKLLINLEELL